MPGAAINSGMVDFVLPVAQIPERVRVLADSAQKLVLEPEPEKLPSDPELNALRDILTLVRVRTGHDFTHYKRPTLLRRISRRLQVHELATFAEYLERLHHQPEEVNALLSDLLITVTNFYRDPDCFDYLQKDIAPGLFADKTPADLVRVWSVGCATGEEAYSIAILLLEYSAQLPNPPRVQVFGTDIDENALVEARHGLYPPNISVDVSPERLRQFFVTEGDHYRVKKELRETIMFASHNVLRDPPFSKLDLIACRNLLIYLTRDMQERVLGLLHFALRPSGILFLGASESADATPTLFEPLDRKRRFYRRRQVIGLAQPWPSLVGGKWQPHLPSGIVTSEQNHFSLGQLHLELVEQLAPPSFLIDEQYDLLHISESAGRFLRFPGGEPTRNLLKVIHPDLRLDLRTALTSAKVHGSNSRRIGIHLNDIPTMVQLTVRTIMHGVTPGNVYYLVMIDESTEAPPRTEDQSQSAPERDRREEMLITDLENELQRTRDELRMNAEQNETSNEELKASNEELQAINEELRSATEELETSKEELQSVNEELTTVNQEYREKLEEVGHANSDLHNLMASTDIGTIFLDRALKIRFYTPRVQRLFSITQADLGRPLEHFTSKLDYQTLTQDAEQVLKTLQGAEREVRALDGSWYLARFLPYRTLDDRIEGVVLTFVDISSRRATEEELKRQAERLKRQAEMLDTAPMLLRDTKEEILAWNTASERLFGYTEQEALGKNIDELLRTDYPATLSGVKQQVLLSGHWDGELKYTAKAGNRILVASRWMLHSSESEQQPAILEIDKDITATRRDKPESSRK